VTIHGAEPALFGDPDGCCEFGVESAAFEFDLADPVVERLIGEPHQTVDEIEKHAPC
jgi:hypothetical protein